MKQAALPKDLFCATCQHTVRLLQKERETRIMQDGAGVSVFVHSLGYHISKIHRQLCAPANFRNLEHASARMHVTCKHLLDHWEDAANDAADQNPWVKYKNQIMWRASGNRDAAFLRDEREALCTVAEYPPCSAEDLKDEL